MLLIYIKVYYHCNYTYHREMYFGNFFRNEKFHSLLSSFYFLKYFSAHNEKNEFVKSRDISFKTRSQS